MALEQITSKILDDAKQEKARILQRAAGEKSKILKAAEEQATLLRKQTLDKAREEADSHKRTSLINHRWSLKNAFFPRRGNCSIRFCTSYRVIAVAAAG